jgi:hypothetical protein
MLNSIAKQGQSKTALDRAEAAIQGNDYPALAYAAIEIARLSETTSYLVEPLIVIADRLGRDPGYQAQAIEAARDAATRARSGSVLERQAVEKKAVSWRMNTKRMADITSACRR